MRAHPLKTYGERRAAPSHTPPGPGACLGWSPLHTPRARAHARRGAFDACLGVTTRILEDDPYALQCLPMHLAACVALGRKAELFMRGHQLVEEYPDKAIAWFAVRGGGAWRRRGRRV